jgi:hypothetical protein
VVGRREDLDFHSEIGGIANAGRPDADAVIRARRQLELEAEDKVGILPVRNQIAAPALGTVDRAIGDAVAVTLFFLQIPATQSLSIEEFGESRVGGVGGKAAREDGGDTEAGQDEVRMFHGLDRSVASLFRGSVLAHTSFEVLAIDDGNPL